MDRQDRRAGGIWCWRTRRHLTALTDRELSPRRAARLQRHLDGCPACRCQHRELETAVAGQRHLLGALARPAAVDVDLLWQDVRRRTAAESAPRRWSWNPVFATVTVAAAVVLFAVALDQIGPSPSAAPEARRDKVVPAPNVRAERPAPRGDSLASEGGQTRQPARREQQLAKAPAAPAEEQEQSAALKDPPSVVAEAPEMFVEYELLRRLEALEHFETVQTFQFEEDSGQRG